MIPWPTGPEGGAVSCPWCKGTGYSVNSILKDGYYYATQIVDCIDFGEFNALSAANKDAIKLIVSAGYVNMNEGNPPMIKLFMCFPEGTNTCTRLLAMIG